VDNSPVTWSPRLGLLLVGWLFSATAAAGAILTGLGGDTRGTVLFAVGCAFFAAISASGTALRPKLAVDTEGLTVRTLSGTRRFAWARTRVRLVRTRRLGRETETVEIESGDVLLILGWIELGADPRDVVDVLSAYRT